MTLPLFVVDAFTSEPFRGNPAAVVLLDGPADDGWMQRVAAEMRHSETAFVRRRDDGAFDLRWFTPATEVDLCGHATLAGAHVLWETGTLAQEERAVFHTRGGVLAARRSGDAIELDFPATVPVPEEPISALFDALGLPQGPMWRAGSFYVVVEVADAAAVRAVDPDFAALGAVDGVRATIVCAPGDDGFDVVSRVFGPAVGIDEDPVTGSAHCVLGPMWCARLGTSELRASQASARGGEMHVRVADDRVYLSGSAVTVVGGGLRAHA